MSIFLPASNSAAELSIAAAYSWIHELCIGPYDPMRDRFVNAPDAPIQPGIFTMKTATRTAMSCWTRNICGAAMSRIFCLLHAMNVDDADTVLAAIRHSIIRAAQCIDALLADILPGWLCGGLSDCRQRSRHESDGWHNGQSDAERDVPVWLIGDAFDMDSEQMPRQEDMYATMRALLEY